MSRTPDSPAEALLSATRRYTRAGFTQSPSLTSGELSRADWYLMWLLQSWPDPRGARPSELARRQRVTAGNVAQQLRKLENQNLVTRTHDEKDRRVIMTKLTALGEKRLKEVHSEFLNEFARLVEHLGKDNTAHLVRLLTSAAEYLETTEPSSC